MESIHRLFCTCVVAERAAGFGTDTQIIPSVILALSEDEARGVATKEMLERFPHHRIAGAYAAQVNDGAVLKAAAILSNALDTPIIHNQNDAAGRSAPG